MLSQPRRTSGVAATALSRLVSAESCRRTSSGSRGTGRVSIPLFVRSVFAMGGTSDLTFAPGWR